MSSAEKVIIDSNTHPWTSIGRVNRAGYRATSMCTGTLIEPNIVLTAAHCLFDRVTGRAFKPEDVVFLAGVRREEYSARLQAKCFRIDPDYRPKDKPQLQTLYSDVALIILDTPSSLATVAQVTPEYSSNPPRDIDLVSVGYHKDRRFLPTADPSCKLIGTVKGSWLTDCLTKQGASGGPVFRREGDNLKVTAIMSAKAGDKASVVVPRERWQPLLETAQCDQPPAPQQEDDADPFAPQPLSTTIPSQDVPPQFGQPNNRPPALQLRPSLD